MNRHSVRLLAAAFAAAGLAGCFDDPTSSLRNGPTDLLLSHTTVAVVFGDSIRVEARAVDSQGNVLPITGAAWTTDNASVAAVNVAATQMPDEASSRAYVRATSAAGGYTYVRVSGRGLTDSIRVVTVPDIILPAGVATVSADGDTLIVNASNGMYFGANTTVRVGAATTYLFSRTATQIKALVRGPVNDSVTIVNSLFGDGSVSSIGVDTLVTTDVVVVDPVTFPAASATARTVASAYGADLKLLPPAGTKFTTSSAVTLGTASTMILYRGPDSLVVLARAATGGAVTMHVTNLTATAGGAIDSLRLPAAPGVTVGAPNLPAASAAVRVSATYGDELKLTPPPGTSFNSGTSTVLLGGTSAMLRYRSADSIIAFSRGAATANVMVTNLAGTNGSVDSVRTAGTVTLAAATLPNTSVTVRTGPLGTNTEMLLRPPAGLTFSAANSNVVLGADVGTRLVATADSIVVINTNAYNGTVKVTNLRSGALTVDSLRTVGSFNLAGAAFPGTVTQLGAGGLMDTILVIGGATADFTTTGASASNVTINGARAIMLRRATDTLYVLGGVPGTSTVSVSNVVVGTATVSTLVTANTVTVGAGFTDATEPTNDAPGASAINLTGATAANPLIIYGSGDGDGNGLGTDADDFYAFTLAASGTVFLRLEFAGTGAGGATNPDFDLLACNAACGAFVGGFGGATAGNPETLTLNSIAAGTYNVYVNAWATGSVTRGYRLLVWQ